MHVFLSLYKLYLALKEAGSLVIVGYIILLSCLELVFVAIVTVCC